MNDLNEKTNPYTVKVKSGAGWRGYNTARLQISVGQAYHEGDKLEATLDWANARFEKVVICVNDTLQRFNHCFEQGMPEKFALLLSKEQGDKWLERNAAVIGTLKNCEIHRWDEWRELPAYTAELERAQKLYAEEADFREAVEWNINDFWSRRKTRLGFTEDYRYASFAKFSKQYLLEEVAAFFLMFEKERAADVYPGSFLLPNQIGAKYCPHFDGANMGYRGFTRIDFSRKDNAERKAG